ncbi:MAG: KGG domain-containing protein [Holdemanella sp.]|uniref:KGG domain-containing protein n=1 Tax=Holdemanella sp. TaxID=1971762 RepID=UPI002586D7E4|nr:KGG domain-containing protein [Holdemanella sp.]MCI7166831.1 KGG domain-containing protein [Holdemanella sp.]
MVNKSNLKPLSTEKAREIGKKGGKKSVESKRKRKALKEQMEMLLSLPLTDDKAKAQFERMGIDSDDMDNQMAMVVKTYLQAMKGNINAVNVIREIIGERVMEVNVNNNIDDKVKELDRLLDSVADNGQETN